MSQLPPDEWLHLAKRLAVGQKRRVNHTCGRTSSLDVYNNDDSWSCWCFRCHDGGRVLKEHQSIRVVQEDTSRMQPVPASALHISQVSRYEQSRIWKLLIQKGCPPGVIPENMIWYDKTSQRILLRMGKLALGRALNEQQLPKWLVYSDELRKPPIVWTRFRGVKGTEPVILVEDILSALKVAKALELYAPGSCVSVGSVLGTSVTLPILRLIAGHDVVCYFDGDVAGRAGCTALRRRVSVFGGAFYDAVPEQGDPKDESCEGIWRHLCRVLNNGYGLSHASSS